MYERAAEGRLQLGAVEYVVLQAGWDATHGAPPLLAVLARGWVDGGDRLVLAASALALDTFSWAILAAALLLDDDVADLFDRLDATVHAHR